MEFLRRFRRRWRPCRRRQSHLVCVGEIDPVAPVAAAREIVDAMPGGKTRLEVIKDAGHFFWKDAADRFWPVIGEFVGSAPTAPSY
jgi:pimeloyl-ACP methyl ester carboxylesterase